jgi:hypothetical protein
MRDRAHGASISDCVRHPNVAVRRHFRPRSALERRGRSADAPLRASYDRVPTNHRTTGAARLEDTRRLSRGLARRCTPILNIIHYALSTAPVCALRAPLAPASCPCPPLRVAVRPEDAPEQRSEDGQQ